LPFAISQTFDEKATARQRTVLLDLLTRPVMGDARRRPHDLDTQRWARPVPHAGGTEQPPLSNGAVRRNRPATAARTMTVLRELLSTPIQPARARVNQVLGRQKSVHLNGSLHGSLLVGCPERAISRRGFCAVTNRWTRATPVRGWVARLYFASLRHPDGPEVEHELPASIG